MSDLISRQAVEEMIKAEMPERGMWEIEGDKEKETVCEVCVDLMQKLSDLPPVTPQTRWIPTSERLPEVMDGTNGECSDDVLICVEDEKRITISTGFYGYYPCSQSEQGWWGVWAHGCEQLDNKCEVLAWMPLPELYKESEGTK